MPFNGVEVRFEYLRAAVLSAQCLETAELLHELGRAIGSRLFQIVDAEQCVVIQGSLSETDLESICRLVGRWVFRGHV